MCLDCVWKLLSLVWLFATPWTVVCQALLSMGFSRQEHWSGSLFPSPGDLPNPGIKSRCSAVQVDSLLSKPPEKSRITSRAYLYSTFLCFFFFNLLVYSWYTILFSAIQKIESVMHIPISTLFKSLSPFRSLQSIEKGSLYSTAGPYKFLFYIHIHIYILYTHTDTYI